MIVFIIGILAAIATPSLSGVLEAARMKQAAVEIRTAFQETQRQSIRNNRSCNAQILISGEETRASSITGSCLSSGDRALPQGIGLATNVLPISSDSSSSESDSNSDNSGTSSSPSNNSGEDDDISVIPDAQSMKIHRASLLNDLLCYWKNRSACDSDSNQREPDKQADIEFGYLGAAKFNLTPPENSVNNNATAQFISFRPNQMDAKKSCVVLSGSLGLTRIGTYQGSLDPVDISTTGKCKVSGWTEQ